MFNPVVITKELEFSSDSYARHEMYEECSNDVVVHGFILGGVRLGSDDIPIPQLLYFDESGTPFVPERYACPTEGWGSGWGMYYDFD